MLQFTSIEKNVFSVVFLPGTASCSRNCDVFHFLQHERAVPATPGKDIRRVLNSLTKAELIGCEKKHGAEQFSPPHYQDNRENPTELSNAVPRCREFASAANVTGLVLTKLDGTGKGGSAAGIQNEFHLPVLFAGLREQPDNLQNFDPDTYTEAIFISLEKQGEKGKEA